MANKESKSLHTINSLTFIVDRKHILLQSTKLTTETRLFALLKEYFIQQNKKVMSFFTHQIVSDPFFFGIQKENF